MKKKTIILGTIIVGVLVAATIVPIVLLNKKDDEEKDQKDVEAIAKILKEKTVQERTIELDKGLSGKIIAKNKASIIEKIKFLIGNSNLKGVSIEVSIKEDKEISTIATPIVVILKKGEISIEIKEEKVGDNRGFKVKRALNDSDSINNVAQIINGKPQNEKVVTIINLQAKVGDSGVANKIKAKVEEKIGSGNLEGVQVSISADANNADILDTGIGVGFKITLSKGSGQVVEITNWKVKRAKPNEEKETDSINNVAQIINGKPQNEKVVTIINLQAKVGDSGVANKIKAKVEEKIGSGNLEGVQVSISADANNADILDTGIGVGFKITLSKGSGQVVEITNWKVKRAKPNEEKETDSINNVAQILNQKLQNEKVVTIINLQAKVGDSGVANKIKAKVEEKIGSGNLEGVQVSISADANNADILDTGLGVGFKITLSKGSGQVVEITNWKVKRAKPNEEKETDSINNVAQILNQKPQNEKVVTIINLQAKVGDSGVANKIKAKVEEKIGSGNLEGVQVSISADANNADILDTGIGVGFKITLSKGSGQVVEITNWKVKREKPNEEKETDSINNVAQILNQKPQNEKVVTIINLQAKVGDSGVANKIKTKVEEKIGSGNLEGVQVSISADANNADILDTGLGVGFKITLSKGSGQVVEITNWKVKRAKTTDERIVDTFVDKLNRVGTKEVILETPGGIISENKGEIKRKIKTLPDFPQLPDGVTLEVKDSNTSITNTLVSITLVVKKGEIEKEITRFSVKRLDSELDIVDSIKDKLNAIPVEKETIILPANTTGNVNDNKEEIIKQMRILIDPTNTNGDANHKSLKGTTIEFFTLIDGKMENDITTIAQRFMVIIQKTDSKGTVYNALPKVFKFKKATS